MDLKAMCSLPWCIIGDFNDLLSQEDKKGQHPHPNWLSMGFTEVITECNLQDVKLEGYPFTWIKSRGTTRVVEERLDRALVTPNWADFFPNVCLLNLLASHSDHSPLLLQTDLVVVMRHSHSFKFENNWLKEPDIDEVVSNGWGLGTDGDVVDRLKLCADGLQRWGRRKRVRFKEKIQECGEEIELLQMYQDPPNSNRYKELIEQHATLLIQEEAFWKQRAKMHWLKEGDLNTNFFHMSAKIRGKARRVEKLLNDDNNEVSSQHELCDVAHKYFEALFRSEHSENNSVLDLIEPKITLEDNIELLKPITKEELRLALFQMHLDKSPGLDGFNVAFFQRFWSLCGDEIFEATKCWMDRGFIPSSLNKTNICLVPKCDSLKSMKDMRPISLCNVLYKMLSKLLANILKRCMSKCVSEEQSAFLEGRSIHDNALVAIEAIHAMKRKTKGWRGDLALKIDISKAYDRVD